MDPAAIHAFCMGHDKLQVIAAAGYMVINEKAGFLGIGHGFLSCGDQIGVHAAMTNPSANVSFDNAKSNFHWTSCEILF